MTAPNAGEMTCPQCGHSNPPKSDYCWECRFDFVPDDRARAAARAPARPAAAPRPIPPPYSRTPAEPNPKPKSQVSPFAFLLELVVSSIIVGGSWFLISLAWPSPSLLYFLLGWGAALLLVVLSEGHLPDPETDISEYWSLNPFEFKDNRNRFVLNWHIVLFLPRIVLRTIRRGFSVLSSAR